MKRQEREPTPADISALSRRITRAAGPALLRKRHRAITESEYIAAWTRPLLPLACVCTFAGAVILMVSPQPRTEPNADEAILNAATNDITTPQLVDIVLHPTNDEDVPPAPMTVRAK